MRTPIIAGNWKMYQAEDEALQLGSELKGRLSDVSGVTVVICPPFTSLSSARGAIEGSPILLGAQDMHWEKEGAYTGEISPVMLLTNYALSHIHAKIQKYTAENASFEKKYGETFQKLKCKVDLMENEENFEWEDDLMDWEFAVENLTLWRKRLQDIQECS